MNKLQKKHLNFMQILLELEFGYMHKSCEVKIEKRKYYIAGEPNIIAETS